MDEKSLQAIEYDRMREELSGFARSSLGSSRAAVMSPLGDLSSAAAAMDEAAEAMDYSSVEGAIPLDGISGISPYMDRLDKEGVLIGKEIREIGELLLAGQRVARDIDDVEKYPHLYVYAQGISPLYDITSDINRALDETGEVKDSATPQLRRIRKSIASQKDELRGALDRILKVPDMKKWLQELIITQRSGRYVVPVRSDSLSHVKGITHGRSGSGATIFVEPIGIVNLNNALEKLYGEEEDEVLRILRRLCDLLGDELDPLYANLEILTELDFIVARAGYASALNATPPQLVKSPVLRLNGARHPFLVMNRDAEEVVPIDVDLGVDYDGMIISGPNAGGKTVALKTSGLLAAMALSGIPIPTQSDSTVGFFNNILADIGDESSIEGNLSTFTSHMSAIKKFLGDADKNTLVLLDEIGVGTSPKYGVAISVAVLRFLRGRGARVMATTHYDDLKVFALEEEGFINAAVEFDTETMLPLYRLIPGRPGSSEAIAILERMGFPPTLIENARELLGEEEVSLSELLTLLEEKSHQAAGLAAEMELLRDDYEQKLQELDAERRRAKETAASSREEAHREAARIIKEARKQAATLIRELKDAEDVKTAEKTRSKLTDIEREAKKSATRFESESGEKAPDTDFVPGDTVLVRGTATRGEIVEVDYEKNRARVKFGGVAANVDLADLEKVKADKKKKAVKTPETPAASLSIKLLGMTGEEAEVELDRYLDRAARAGLATVEVVHGYGTGRLRIAVHAFLRTHPLVRSFGLTPGNDGATEVTLKK